MALAFFAVVCLMFDGELPVYLAYETVLLDTLFFLAACGLIAVSYTHLDVYKRQACNGIFHCEPYAFPFGCKAR